jgi:hypothetical protein
MGGIAVSSPGAFPITRVKKAPYPEAKKGGSSQAISLPTIGPSGAKAEGYIEVKVSDIKKPDGDNRNFDPDNLLLISRKELIVMNHLGLIYNHKDLTAAGKTVADLKMLIAERKRKIKRRQKS